MSFFKGMVALSLLTSSVFAARKCTYRNANELLSAIKVNHPSLIKKAREVEMAKLNIDAANKLINPEVEIEGISNLDEGSHYTTSVKLMQTIELGGKRSARVKAAKEEVGALKSLTAYESEMLIIKIVKNLYELKHLNEVIPLYVESLDAFKRIHRKLSKRSSLSPEQQVERETLELVISDYRLKLANLKVDRTYLKNHLGFFSGRDCEITNSALPKKLNLNLKLAKIDSVEGLSFSKLRYAKKLTDLQVARLEQERGQAYTNLRVGPTFEMDKEDETVKKAGVAISFDLPLFNRNGAAKARARVALESARFTFNKAKKEANLDLYSWKAQYNKYVSSLKVMANNTSLDMKHKKVESLFKRGIISTAMVIESHRQLIEYSMTRNEFEVGAVEALWNIYNFSGELMKKEIL